MTRTTTLLFSLLIIPFAACSSSGPDEPGTRVEGEEVHKHTAEFLLTEAAHKLRASWQGIDTFDVEGRELITIWHVNLHPHSEMGYRERLVVTLEGEPGAWRYVAREEKELNHQQRDTLSMDSAEWKATGNDGAHARAFLLAMRLHLRKP